MTLRPPPTRSPPRPRGILSLVTASLATLLFLTLSAPPAPAAAARHGHQVFEYFHATRDGTVHGTVSDLDGAPRSTWTVTSGAKKETFDQPIAADDFRALVAGFALPELRPYEVTRPDPRLDFVTFQVVSLVEVGPDGRVRARRTFLVPAAPEPRRIREWLGLARIPGPAAPTPRR